MGRHGRRALDRRRTLAACLACGVPAAALALDSGVALARGWRPMREVEWLALGALTLLALVAAALVLARVGRRTLRRWWAPAILLSLCATGALLALELVRPPKVARAGFHLRQPRQQAVFEPDARWVPGVTGKGRLTSNSRGVRGEELPRGSAAYRILCVGGSTTECLYLDDGEAWTGLLQERLARSWGRPVWVGGAGVSGFATLEHLPFLATWPGLAEVDCVLMLVGINDFALVALGGRDPVAPSWTAPVWTRSSAMRMFKNLHWRVRGAPLYQDAKGEWYEERRKVRRFAPKLSGLPDLREALGEYEARLDAIAETCARRGVELVFLTQPVLWREGLGPEDEALLWLGWSLDRGSFYDARTLREGMDLYNRRLVEVAGRHGLRVVDLSRLSGDGSVFYDDCHFTEAGSRRVADLVEAQLACPADVHAGP